MMIEGPFLWYLNRGTGVVAARAADHRPPCSACWRSATAGRGLPRFVTQALHRNLALLSVVAARSRTWSSAVVDEYVDIRWWQAFVPVGATYEPLWLGLGAIALDLILVVVVTSMLRHRMRHRAWRLLHVSPGLVAAVARCTASAWAPTSAAAGGWSPSPRRRGAARGDVRLGAALPPGSTRPEPRPRSSVTVPRSARTPMTRRPSRLAGADPDRVTVEPGPALLAGIEHGPSLAAHRRQYGDLPRLDRDALHRARCSRFALRGRGGAAFPFAHQARGRCEQRAPAGAGRQHERGRARQRQGRRARADPAAPRARRRRRGRPGAAATGAARRAPRRPAGRGHRDADGARRARRRRCRVHSHVADPRFVAGQAKAVVELLSGRPNLPVTSWQPDAVSGHQRPADAAEQRRDLGPARAAGAARRAGVRRRRHPRRARRDAADPEPPGRRPASSARRRTAPGCATSCRRARTAGRRWSAGSTGRWATWETLASARVSVAGLRGCWASPLGRRASC